jgi:cytochrome c oxidase subunit II
MKIPRLFGRGAALALGAYLTLVPGLAGAVSQAERGPCDPALEVCPATGYGLPQDISAEGYRIDELIHTTTYMLVAIFVFLFGWLLYVAFGHNEKRHKAVYDPGGAPRDVAIKIGLLAGGIFFIVDGNLFYHAMVDLGTTYWNYEQFHDKREPEILRVEVNAHQWAWDLRYAGSDAEFGTKDDVVVMNELRVPADVPVWIQLTSVDVIHAFYLPNLRIKFDAMPGMLNDFWFKVKPEFTGRYDIACAQHCGANHYKMKGQLIVLPREDFDAWLTQASTNAARLNEPNANDTEANWAWPWRETGK